MAKQRSTRDQQMRLLLAQEAARLMAGDGRLDYYSAKRKAAEHLGADDTRNLPRNSEVEAALQEYQRIFLTDSHPQRVRHLREAAVEAMEMLAEFDPHLAGPVLLGTAGPHSEIQLHLYAPSVETVSFHLMDQGIPYDLHETFMRFNGEEHPYPSLRFIAGEDTIDLVVFPERRTHQAPKSPVDGKAMKRARLDEVRNLLEETAEA